MTDNFEQEPLFDKPPVPSEFTHDSYPASESAHEQQDAQLSESRERQGMNPASVEAAIVHRKEGEQVAAEAVKKPKHSVRRRGIGPDPDYNASDIPWGER